MHDDPELSNRLWHGANPIRMVTDMDLKLPSSLKLFNKEIPTIIFNAKRHTLEDIAFYSSHPLGKEGIGYYQVTTDVDLVQQVMNALYQLKIQSVFVEGGARLLQSFIDENYWDEIRLITNKEMRLEEGIASPSFRGLLLDEQELFSDRIEIFKSIESQ
jgi:diaminohydroxyphosphoribosylaminopyrimidine deaminase/5-amino-6-(5-phosphoribosylamino)uracil reductase